MNVLYIFCDVPNSKVFAETTYTTLKTCETATHVYIYTLLIVNYDQ